MFTGKPAGKAQCQLCMKTQEAVQVKFQDGLAGTFCFGCFKKAVKARHGAAKDVEAEK